MPQYVIDTLKPKNNNNFPVAEAVDVLYEEGSTVKDKIIAINALIVAAQQLIEGIQTDISELQSGKVDKVSGKGLSTNDFTNAYKDKIDDTYTKSETDTALAGKVDKVSGKGLSTNDFTNTYKNKVDNTYTKTETDSAIAGKIAEVVAEAPESLDTLKEIADWIDTHADSASAMNSAIQANAANIEKKVDKVEGKTLSSNDFTDVYKNKVDDTYIKTEVDSKLKDKVDKESGKGLSTNDFTDEYQVRVHDAYANTIENASEIEKLKSSKADKTALSETNQTVENNRANLQGQIDTLVLEAGGDSNPEVVQARIGSDGTVHGTLKARLDEMDTIHTKDVTDLKNELSQYYETIEGAYADWMNGGTNEYSGLTTVVVPVSAGMNVEYTYTFWEPDRRGVVFRDQNGMFVSGIQTQTTPQTFVVPDGAVTMRATVTDVSQISLFHMAKAISLINPKITQAQNNAVNQALNRSISCSEICVNNDTNLPNANDADNNKIYMILATRNVLNLPYNDYSGGTLITVHYGGSEYSVSRTQIFISDKNELWYRIEWGDGWNDWGKCSQDNAMPKFKGIVTSSNLDDFNNAVINGYYIINETNILNMPTANKGVLICFSGYPNNQKGKITGGKVQIYVDNSNAMFYRSTKFTSELDWYNWVKVNKNSNPNSPIAENMTSNPLEYITEDVGLLRCFDTVGCIGDSLSSGECAYKDSSGNSHYVDMYDISWGQCLARMTGRTYYNFSVGGLSAKDFMTSANAKVRQFDDGEHVCKMYFIGLGQNDCNQSVPVGTSADINSESPTTYYGYYGKIIRKIKEMQPKAKIFVITDPLSTTEAGGYNAAVRDMVNLFTNVYLIDMYTYGDSIYNESNSFIKKNYRQYHYNAVGYQTMAYVISTYVNWIMKKNPNEFREIEFIGTEYNYY